MIGAIPRLMENNDYDASRDPKSPNKGMNTPVFLYAIGAFLIAALLAATCWFWYAGHRGLSATPHEGPTGVGGMTAGSKK